MEFRSVKQDTYIEVADARLEGNDWSSYGHGGKMADVSCVREDVREEEEWKVVVDGGQAARNRRGRHDRYVSFLAALLSWKVHCGLPPPAVAASCICTPGACG
jgi:hypothetical protein